MTDQPNAAYKPVQQPTWRHHFIPEFYTKRWMLGGERFVEFSQPRKGSDEVKPRLVYPRQTGFVDKLYALKGLSPDQAADIEDNYFKPVDRAASDVLTKFENGVNFFPGKERSAWTQFLLTLLLRTPEELEAAKSIVLSEWYAKADRNERQYQKVRQEGDPATWRDFLATVPSDALDRASLSGLVAAMRFERCGQHIVNMRWGSFRFPWLTPALMTSDRPLLIMDGLSHPDCCLLLPIGPKLLFYAVNNPQTEEMLRGYHASSFGEYVNRMVVSRAHRFSYGTTDRNIRFVRQYFSTEKAPVMAAKASMRMREKLTKEAPKRGKRVLARD